MGLFDRFTKPKWQHEDSSVRFEAIEKLDDQEILINIAQNDSDWLVREKAVKKVKNESVLADIVKNDEEKIYVRKEAIKNIKDKSLLVDIAKNIEKGDSFRYRDSKYLDQILDTCFMGIYGQSIFIDLAKNAAIDEVRKRAVTKIRDQSVLEDIAINDESSWIRGTAIEKVDEESVLIPFVKNLDNGQASREIAISKINDKTFLLDIADNDEDGYISNVAQKRILELTDDSELLQKYKDSSDDYERAKIVSQMTDQSILMDIVKNSSDHIGDSVRKEAIKKLSDDNLLSIVNTCSEEYILVDIATNTSNLSIARAAFKGIHGEGSYAYIAKKSPSEDIAKIALEHVNDDYLLADISNGGFSKVSWEANRKHESHVKSKIRSYENR